MYKRQVFISVFNCMKIMKLHKEVREIQPETFLWPMDSQYNILTLRFVIAVAPCAVKIGDSWGLSLRLKHKGTKM